MQISINLPKSIRMDYALLFASMVLIFELMCGTDVVFGFLMFLFIMLSVLTINLLGGLVTLGGICVAALALRVVVISQVAKILLWQPADSYLDEPVATAGVLTLGMAAFLVAAQLARSVRPKVHILKPELKATTLLGIAVTAYVLGGACHLYVYLFGLNAVEEQINVGGLIAIARMVTWFFPLSIICGTAYKILVSKGERSVGLLVLIAVLTQLALGVLTTSKQLMFEPFLYYLLTCIALRFRFQKIHFVAFFAVFLFAITIAYPFAQYGRGITRSFSPDETLSLTLDLVKNMLSAGIFHWDDARIALENFSEGTQRFQYYGVDKGVLDRFSLIEQDDELVNATLEKGLTEWTTINHGFERLVPRSIYEGKPLYDTGNYLGHRIDALNLGDNSTQLAFGFIAESFSAFSWLGVFLISFFVVLSFFLLYQKLTGNIYYNVWTIFLVGYFQQAFVEATISVMLFYLIEFPLVVWAMSLFLRSIGGSPILWSLLKQFTRRSRLPDLHAVGPTYGNARRIGS